MAISVSIESLSFSYRGSVAYALKDISGEIEEGSFLAVMGHGGAGKSTLSAAMNGLVPRFFRGNYSGRLAVNGHEVAKCGVVELSRMVGLALQDFEAQLFPAMWNLKWHSGLRIRTSRAMLSASA